VNKTFLSLRHRNFRLYFMSQIISNTGNWLTNVALTLLVLKLTHSGLAVGLLAACQYGPILLFSAWAGAIADRSDKRRLLFITQGIEMAESVGLAIIAFLPHSPLAGAYVLALMGGAALAFDNPLRRSFVSEMVPVEDVPNAVVLYSTSFNLARIIGPSLAGLLVITVGYGWCFTIDAISYLPVLAGLWLMAPAELRRRPPTPRVKGEIREGVRYILSTPRLWVSFVMLTAIGALSYNFPVTLPLFVTKSLHQSSSVYTILYSIFSCGAVACAMVLARRSQPSMRQVINGAAALGITTLLLASAPSVGAAAVVVFLVGAASLLYTTSTTANVQLETKPEMRGRVLSLQTVFFGGPTAFGGPMLGALADTMGGRAPLILGGVVALLAAAFGYFASKRHIWRPRLDSNQRP
jgi:MFS family permease